MHADKIGHFSAYFTLAMLFSLISSQPRNQLIFIIIACGGGISLEIIQGHLPNRETSVLDALTNTAGLILGTVFTHCYYSKLPVIFHSVLRWFPPYR